MIFDSQEKKYIFFPSYLLLGLYNITDTLYLTSTDSINFFFLFGRLQEDNRAAIIIAIIRGDETDV